jgi:hypothetical protein
MRRSLLLGASELQQLLPWHSAGHSAHLRGGGVPRSIGGCPGALCWERCGRGCCRWGSRRSGIRCAAVWQPAGWSHGHMLAAVQAASNSGNVVSIGGRKQLPAATEMPETPAQAERALHAAAAAARCACAHEAMGLQRWGSCARVAVGGQCDGRLCVGACGLSLLVLSQAAWDAGLCNPDLSPAAHETTMAIDVSELVASLTRYFLNAHWRCLPSR